MLLEKYSCAATMSDIAKIFRDLEMIQRQILRYARWLHMSVNMRHVERIAGCLACLVESFRAVEERSVLLSLMMMTS